MCSECPQARQAASAHGARRLPAGRASLRGGSDPVALTPQVKEGVAEEVKAQLAEDKAAAVSAPLPEEGSKAPPAHRLDQVPGTVARRDLLRLGMG
jgi:hypothetical protein